MARAGSAHTEKWESEDYDEKGWAPIHYAAHSGYFKTVSRLIEQRPNRLEVRTQDKLKVTPLWLAFSEGRIETVDTLLIYGADVSATDTEMRDIMDIAFVNRQHKLLLHLMKKVPDLRDSLWENLNEYTKIDYLDSGDLLVALKIITDLSKDSMLIESKEHTILEWVFALYKPEYIVDNLNVEMALVSILQNLSGQLDELEQSKNVKLLEVLTERLVNSTKKRLQNNILSILHARAVSCESTGNVIKGKRMVDVVQYMEVCQDENNLLKTIDIILQGSKNNPDTQNFLLQQTNLLTSIINILKAKQSDTLHLSALKFLRYFSDGNKSIQKKLIEVNIFEPLKLLLSSKSKSITKEISKLICATTKENKELQMYFIKCNAIQNLSQQIKKIKNDVLYECIVKALWDIGGNDHKQLLLVARSIDLSKVFSLATSNSSEVLQHYGGEFLRVHMRLGNHCLPVKLRETVLVHLLNSSLKSILMTSEMIISALKTIQCICFKRGYTPVKKIQNIALEKNSIQVLLQASTKVDDPWIELEVYQTISTILLCHPNSTKIITEQVGLPLTGILRHLSNTDSAIRSKASHVLACMLLDKENKKKFVRRFSLPVSFYNFAEELSNDYIIVNTAFQLIVLRDFISESSGVETSIIGIEILQRSLENSSGDIIATAADHISGIAQYCPGMKAVFTTAGFVDKLCDLMRHDDDTVKTAVAVAICILARCLKAEILLLKRCRKEEKLVSIIEDWNGSVPFPQHFKSRWIHYKSINVNKDQFETEDENYE